VVCVALPMGMYQLNSAKSYFSSYMIVLALNSPDFYYCLTAVWYEGEGCYMVHTFHVGCTAWNCGYVDGVMPKCCNYKNCSSVRKSFGWDKRNNVISCLEEVNHE
jgi:hypothetical protein